MRQVWIAEICSSGADSISRVQGYPCCQVEASRAQAILAGSCHKKSCYVNKKFTLVSPTGQGCWSCRVLSFRLSTNSHAREAGTRFLGIQFCRHDRRWSEHQWKKGWWHWRTIAGRHLSLAVHSTNSRDLDISFEPWASLTRAHGRRSLQKCWMNQKWVFVALLVLVGNMYVTSAGWNILRTAEPPKSVWYTMTSKRQYPSGSRSRWSSSMNLVSLFPSFDSWSHDHSFRATCCKMRF